MASEQETICIIGAGITGLACAQILSKHYKVIIIARDLPGDLSHTWASPWAGALFHPQLTNNPIHQKMQRQSFNYYWNLAKTTPSTETGVAVYPLSSYYDDRTDDSEIWYQDLFADYRILPKSELPSGITFGAKYTTLAMNPDLLLPYLYSQLTATTTKTKTSKGNNNNKVEFIRKTITSFTEARELSGAAKIIVNASGLGAKELASDDTVVSVRGQTLFVKSDFQELIMREGSEYTYVIPRFGSGGVILGGIKETERLDTEVDEVLRGDILRRVNGVCGGAFAGVELGGDGSGDGSGDGVRDIVGFRPGREGGVRVEREGDVVHAYGVGGAGYIYSFGVAERVFELIKGVEVADGESGSGSVGSKL